MKFSVFQISRKGGREKNEDRMGYCYTNSSALFLLADGMGGHPEGEVAAQLALQTISALYQKEAKPELPDVKGFFHTAIIAAHRQILRYAADGGLNDTPRTTLVAAVIQGGVAHWVHCGDSRLYFVRDGELLARTRDHSYLEQRGGDSANPPTLPKGINRNVLTHAWVRRPSRFLTSPARCRCSRATRCCCARTACGAVCRMWISSTSWASTRYPWPHPS